MRPRRLAATSALAAIALAVTARAEAPAVWSAATRSPQPLDARGAASEPCGAADAGLAAAAALVLNRPAMPGSDELSFALHAAGEPHPWPRAFAMSGAAVDEPTIAAELKRWSLAVPALGVRRCNVARLGDAGATRRVVAVAVDALADLTTPLPTRARVAQWMTLDARMLVPASDAKVILLGPGGRPKTVLASLDADGNVHSRFAVDSAGGWMVQVLATISTGPKPVLEAMVYAGVEPPTAFTQQPVPGEAAAAGARDDADAVLRMINAARASEGIGDVRRDAALDRLAAAHAEAMQKKNVVGHDVGDGDVMARAQAAGVATGKVLGENVANAPTPVRAHRALWGSPSHRTNLLYPAYRSVGLGVVRDGDVTWVAEIFRD